MKIVKDLSLVETPEEVELKKKKDVEQLKRDKKETARLLSKMDKIRRENEAKLKA